MTDEVISHQYGSSVVHRGEDTHKSSYKKYGYNSVACLDADRAILKAIAKRRGVKMYYLVHEVVVCYTQSHPEPREDIPELLKDIFSLFDNAERRIK